MRTFQQDTVLHIVTERASSLQIAGGVKAQSIMRTLLSENQAIYRSTENELTEGIVTAMTECSFSQVKRHSSKIEPRLETNISRLYIAQIPGMLEMSDSFSASHQRVVGDLELMRDIAMVDVKAMHQAYSLAPQDLDLSETAELGEILLRTVEVFHAAHSAAHIHRGYQGPARLGSVTGLWFALSRMRSKD